MIVFKAVTKNRKSFIDDTEYLDSVTYEEPAIEKDDSILHAKGLTVGSLLWARKRAEEWNGIVLEVFVPDDAIVVYPKGGEGKFRVSKLQVIGEV